MISKLELLQKEHERIQSEAENFNIENLNIKQVLQEKNRESGQMKTENARLLQSIADYKSKGDMAKETVKNLSSVIRDKDLEIDGLKSRNESLVTFVQESSKPQCNNGKSKY